VVTILEGESLVNDATALVAGSPAGGGRERRFSLGDAALCCRERRGVPSASSRAAIVFDQRLSDPPVEMLIRCSPFGAWLPAEAVGVSRCSRW
jgi:hypothetical protein